MLQDVLHPPMIDPRKVRSVEPELLEGDKIKAGDPLFGVIWINPERVHGTPCFYGTRVPIKTLFDCLAAGQTLNQFLDDFDGVERQQALALLSMVSRGLLAELEAL